VIPENIFSVAHTIKGICSFLGRPWLEAPVHFAETFMGNVRDGIRVTSEVATLFLATIDNIKLMLNDLDGHQTAAVVGTTTSLAAQSAAADGSP
jgi:two-component system chemotaxis sensor kinase CheA